LAPAARVDAREAIVVVPPPIDAGVAIAPPPPRRIDAGTVETAGSSSGSAAGSAAAPPPATSLKVLYQQVNDAYNAAVAHHGVDALAGLRRRLDSVPPYTEAVRKPALRAQAETELRALARDLAALGTH
ncbi:MAG TPA: hypothetical protein VHE35_14130, partial [Kofleriaceae bacterium]|nr:hypothetical protein [Kofleriaceae bacterium]